MKEKEASALRAWAASHPDDLARYVQLNQTMSEKQKLKELEEEKRPTEQPTARSKNPPNSLKRLWMRQKAQQPQESEPASTKEPRDERLEQLFQSLVHFSPNETVCDGCLMEPSSKRFNTSPNEGIRVWIGDEEQFSYKHNAYDSAHSPMEITAIYVSMMNRIEFIQQILYRWRG